MNLVCFEKDSGLAEKIQSKLKKKYQSVLVFSDVIRFLSYLRKKMTATSQVFVLASEIDLTLAGIDVNYFLVVYDLSMPIFTYSKDGHSLKIKINYVSNYYSSYSKDYVDSLFLARKIVQDFLMTEVYKSVNSCIFLENDVLQKHTNNLKKDIFTENINMENNDFSTVCASLTKLQRKLFKYLHIHRDGANIVDIEHEIWQNTSNDKTQNVYTLVCGLRNALKAVSGDRYKIIHTQNGYQLLVVS